MDGKGLENENNSGAQWLSCICIAKAFELISS